MASDLPPKVDETAFIALAALVAEHLTRVVPGTVSYRELVADTVFRSLRESVAVHELALDLYERYRVAITIDEP